MIELLIINNTSEDPITIKGKFDGMKMLTIAGGGKAIIFERGITQANDFTPSLVKLNNHTFRNNIVSFRTLQATASSDMRRPLTQEEYYDPNFRTSENYFKHLTFEYSYASDAASATACDYNTFIAKMGEARCCGGEC